jgi:Cu/Ag efflux protein CusF
MLAQPLAAVVSGLLALIIAATMSTVAHIHGKVVSIDAAHGTFQIHHDPFAQMPMAMTMEVKPKNPADLRTLHVGEVIDATVDTSIVPWPGTNIKPASSAH